MTDASGVTIAIDAMGGDDAPGMVIAGMDRALANFPSIKFKLFGDEASISPLLSQYPKLNDVCTIIHTPDHIAPDAKPFSAIRQGKNSSMRLAIDAVKAGEADAIVSAGNTGALMGMSKMVLGTLPGIDRPAIVSIFPTKRGESVLLDLGANAECTGEHLFQFALMGDAFAKVLFHMDSPTVGLLNIGSEAGKGNTAVNAANTLLEERGALINYHGYVEGDDLAVGTVDVVVMDGFSGNIALKTAEGTARISRAFLKDAFKSSILAKIGFFLAKPALTALFRRLDPRLYNGAMLVGLNGISVKSHGGTDYKGFANSISVAVELATNDINTKITHELSVSQITEKAPNNQPANAKVQS